jgi:putative drug exporter of the RND superfamily
LGVIPIMFLVQLAFIVAFGVLLDTVLVRSLLVPALAYDLGPRIWWPNRLGRPGASPADRLQPAEEPAEEPATRRVPAAESAEEPAAEPAGGAGAR